MGIHSSMHSSQTARHSTFAASFARQLAIERADTVVTGSSQFFKSRTGLGSRVRGCWARHAYSLKDPA